MRMNWIVKKKLKLGDIDSITCISSSDRAAPTPLPRKRKLDETGIDRVCWFIKSSIASGTKPIWSESSPPR